MKVYLSSHEDFYYACHDRDTETIVYNKNGMYYGTWKDTPHGRVFTVLKHDNASLTVQEMADAIPLPKESTL